MPRAFFGLAFAGGGGQTVGMSLVLRLLLVLVLGACAALPPGRGAPPPSRSDAVSLRLAPFEDLARIPPELASLPLPEGRAFVLLVQLPAPAVVDLGDPVRARSGLQRFLDPLAVWRAGTQLGHAMVGWRCADGAMGLVSKSGDPGNLGQRLLFQGWGLSAALARYSDGYLVTPAEMPARHRRALAAGRARILAEEVSAAACQSLRRSLMAYLDRPEAERARFGMTAEPDSPLGTGCGGFALWLAGQGGALRGIERHVMRSVLLRDSFAGQGPALPPEVTPPALAPAAPLSPLRLITGDWTRGRVLGQVEVFDMELLLHSLDRARLAPQARLERVPPGLERATRLWLGQFARRVPVRLGQARAMLLLRH